MTLVTGTIWYEWVILQNTIVDNKQITYVTSSLTEALRGGGGRCDGLFVLHAK